MGWFKKRNFQRSIDGVDSDEWITIPFRYGEAVRVSLHTVGMRPEVPDVVRLWISQWLDRYNASLSEYMREKYGDGIFPILDLITKDVLPDPVHPNRGGSDPDTESPPWDRWEKQFGEDEKNAE